MSTSQGRVTTACERCRRQKLKCDTDRPCSMCKRGKVDCIAPTTAKWKFRYLQPGSGQVDTEERTSTNELPASKRRRIFEDEEPDCQVSVQQRSGQQNSSESLQSSAVAAENFSSGARWHSSSTMNLVQEAFQNHLTNPPEEADTSAFIATPWKQTCAQPSNPRAQGKDHDDLETIISRRFADSKKIRSRRRSIRNAVERELALLLPSAEVASLLVNNYFDRIHWFTLLFHQRNFRTMVNSLYDTKSRNALQNSHLDDLAVLLAVLATSLRYTDPIQKRRLVAYGVEPEFQEDRILTALRLRLLDILSMGTLKVVQTCVLLGSYYIYHGEPELAWPLCGCGLRIAQALNLHRKPPTDGSDDHAFKSLMENRKRCWWAVYEIETFCSMLYGFPVSITDADCDVEPLDPYDEWSVSTSQSCTTRQPTLLFYKCAMSELYSIIKSALVDLYGTRHHCSRRAGSVVDQEARVFSLVVKVETLNARLTTWNENLIPKLKFGNLEALAARENAFNSQLDYSTEDPSAFEEHLFKLQAFALRLAYENAKILIHRPLLSFKTVSPTGSRNKPDDKRLDPFSSATQTCRDAALQISWAALSSGARRAAHTYAVTFMSLHLFTASMTLCIITSLDPLSSDSHECKLGVRRLMKTQSSLSDKSIVAFQGLDITRRLMSLAIAKETDAMFNFSPPTRMFEAGTHGMDKLTQNGQVENDEPATLISADAASRVQGLDEGPPLHCVDDTIPELTSIDFCENSSMTEAILEFGQLINRPTSNTTVVEQTSTFDYLEPFDDLFVGQDQAWIWGREL